MCAEWKGLDPPKRFEDLRITLVQGGSDGFQCDVLIESPMVQERHTANVRIPVEPRDVERVLTLATGDPSQWIARAGPEQWSTTERSLDTVDPVKHLGVRLFSGLFEGRLERVYRRALEGAQGRGASVRLRLVLPEGPIAALPWEFLFDPKRQDFVALSELSAVVRQPARTPVHNSIRTKPPLRVLVVGSDVTGKLDVEREIETLRRLEKVHAGLLRLEVVNRATSQDLLEHLGKGGHHVLHFVGTGFPHSGIWLQARQALALMGAEGSPRTDGLPAAGAMLDGRMLRDAVAGLSRLRLVVMSACYTDQIAAELAQVVPAALGIQGEMTSDTCITLAEHLYQSLLKGQPLEAALTEGRRSIDRSNPGGRQWGLPVCYSRAMDGVMLSVSGDRDIPVVQSVLDTATPAGVRPGLERQWKLVAAHLEVHDRNLKVLRRQEHALGGAVNTLLKTQIEETSSRIAELQAELTSLTE